MYPFQGTSQICRGLCAARAPSKGRLATNASQLRLISETIALMHNEHACPVLIDQCTCGTLDKKPTQPLEFNPPELADVVYELPNHGRCFHCRLSKVLVGKEFDGTFLTSLAKEYP